MRFIFGKPAFKSTSKAKNENKLLLLKQEHGDDIRRMANQSIERDHYMIQLFQTLGTYIEDDKNTQLKKYFEYTIAPIYKRSMYNADLKQIKNELIRNLIQNELNQLSSINGLLIDVQLIGNPAIQKSDEIILLKIISELFSNAKKELLKQENGYL